jgi:hypothetical protein
MHAHINTYQEDLAAQRKREAERQRAVTREEDRQRAENQPRPEQKQREDAANSKTAAARQAIEKRRLEVEKAKLTGAPPPAIRPQPNMDLAIDMLQDKAPTQQRSDTARTQSTAYRPHEELGRSTNSALHNTSKAPPKRPLPQDAIDENHSRPATQRNAPAPHDSHQAKRRRTSEIADGRSDNPEPQPKMTAPPIRQSSIRQKVRRRLIPILLTILVANFYTGCAIEVYLP